MWSLWLVTAVITCYCLQCWAFLYSKGRWKTVVIVNGKSMNRSAAAPADPFICFTDTITCLSIDLYINPSSPYPKHLYINSSISILPLYVNCILAPFLPSPSVYDLHNISTTKKLHLWLKLKFILLVFYLPCFLLSP